MPVRRTTLVILLTLLMTGCGKKGPMLYPDLLVAQPPQQLTLEQSGSLIRLSFDLPSRDLAGRKLENLEAVQIARRACRDNRCDSCQNTYMELQKIDVNFPAPAQREGNRIIWLDRGVRSGEGYQYRLKPVQKGGIDGSIAVTPLVRIQRPPVAPVVKVRPVFGGVIVIELEGIPQQEESLIGYRLFRSVGMEPAELLDTLYAGTSKYEDQAVQEGVVYRYGARILVKRGDGVIAESESSDLVSISVTSDSK